MNPIVRAASVALALLIVAVARVSMPAAAQAPSAEEQLAQRYAPIVALKEQSFDCDTSGEPYLPLPVDVVLGAPDVALKQRAASAGRSVDRVVTAGPTV